MHKSCMWYHWDLFLPLEPYHLVQFKWVNRSDYMWVPGLMVTSTQREIFNQNYWIVVLC